MEITSILVIGRRWFQKSYGNTYHTFEIHLNGTFLYRSDPVYGYGDQFEFNALDFLVSRGYLDVPRGAHGGFTKLLSLACRDAGISYEVTVVDVPRERDLLTESSSPALRPLTDNRG